MPPRSPAAREVCLSRLPPEYKRHAWDWMKRNNPDLAELLGQDPTFAFLCEQFDQPTIWVRAEDSGLSTEQLAALPAGLTR